LNSLKGIVQIVDYFVDVDGGKLIYLGCHKWNQEAEEGQQADPQGQDGEKSGHAFVYPELFVMDALKFSGQRTANQRHDGSNQDVCNDVAQVVRHQSKKHDGYDYYDILHPLVHIGLF
jgi:hypothetical protein